MFTLAWLRALSLGWQAPRCGLIPFSFSLLMLVLSKSTVRPCSHLDVP